MSQPATLPPVPALKPKPAVRPQPVTGTFAGRMTVEGITDTPTESGNRWLLYGKGGIGKSSLGACFPRPVFLMVGEEDGLLTLVRQGLLPKTPHFPRTAQSLQDVRDAVSTLLTGDHAYETLVVDQLGALEELVCRDVCTNQYKDQREKFDDFSKGLRSSIPTFSSLLSLFQRLRDQRKMTIVLLAHSRVKNQKNPLGADYGRIMPAVCEPFWEMLQAWCDAILYGQFETTVTKDGLSAKATGGEERVLSCNPSAGYEAKNRFSLPDEIRCGKTPQETYARLSAAVAAGAKGAS